MKATLQQIETFYWIARLGSFHAAARHLHLAQPTISARIRELEIALGLKLFEREKYRAEMTVAGRDVLQQAEKMLQLADELAKTAGRRNPLRGLLRLGANESAAMVGLIELLSRLKASYPELQVELTIDVGTTLSRKLNARELDIAILSDPISAPHVVDEVIGKVALQWVASPQVQLKHDLTPHDIAALPVVVVPSPSTLHSVTVEWFRSAHCEFARFGTCNSMSMMLRLVEAGHAIAILPLPVVRHAIEHGTVRALTVKPPLAPRAYYVSYLREQHELADGGVVAMMREVLTQSGLLSPN